MKPKRMKRELQKLQRHASADIPLGSTDEDVASSSIASTVIDQNINVPSLTV